VLVCLPACCCRVHIQIKQVAQQQKRESCLILAQSVSGGDGRNLIFVRMKIYFSSGSKRKDYGKNPVVVAHVVGAVVIVVAVAASAAVVYCLRVYSQSIVFWFCRRAELHVVLAIASFGEL